MPSMTVAMKGQRVLSANRLSGELVRLPPKYSDAGCSYGLKIASSEFTRAIHILKVSDVAFVRAIQNGVDDR